MRKTRILVGALLMASWCGMCLADVGSDQVKENAELKARIEKLEKELAELKKMVMQQEEAKAKDGGLKAEGEKQPTSAEAVQQTAAEQAKKTEPAKPATDKIPVVAGLEVELYGRVKLDAAYDTAKIYPGDYAAWVTSQKNGRRHDNQLDVTANETRLGMRIFGPKNEEVQTGGKVEIDFYGNSVTDYKENKPNPMLRHAYMTLDWPDDKFGILAGQTSDVISPLFPDTLNYTVDWYVGNIGYRRPQIRLTKSYAIDKDTELKFEGALARTIGRVNTTTGMDTSMDSGKDSGIPSLQGRVSMTFPWWGYKPTTVGFSGHWAKEEYDTTTTGISSKFDSWSLNVDLQQPVNKWLSFKGEWFTGENLDAYLGGIGQGVNTTMFKEIASTGGWVQASLGPWDKWRFNVGASMDDPKNSDLEGMTSAKTLNRSIFGNVIYAVDKNAEIGFELSQWHTEYMGERDADSIRAQTSFIYKF